MAQGASQGWNTSVYSHLVHQQPHRLRALNKPSRGMPLTPSSCYITVACFSVREEGQPLGVLGWCTDTSRTDCRQAVVPAVTRSCRDPQQERKRGPWVAAPLLCRSSGCSLTGQHLAGQPSVSERSNPQEKHEWEPLSPASPGMQSGMRHGGGGGAQTSQPDGPAFQPLLQPLLSGIWAVCSAPVE